MEFGTFKKSALAEEIVTRLLTLVKEEKLRPGDKLPPERELALSMQVSRPSLREALRALAIMNIIDIRQGGGTYIGSLEPDELLSHLEFVFSLDASTLTDLLETQRVLGPGVAAIATERMTPADLAVLEEIITWMGQAVSEPSGFFGAVFDFHQHLARLTKNPILSRMMTSLLCLNQPFYDCFIKSEQERQLVFEQHCHLLYAFQLRDVEAAHVTMFRYLRMLDVNNQQSESINTALSTPYSAQEPPEIRPIIGPQQQHIFEFHQLMVSEHKLLNLTHIMAWEQFWRGAERKIIGN